MLLWVGWKVVLVVEGSASQVVRGTKMAVLLSHLHFRQHARHMEEQTSMQLQTNLFVHAWQRGWVWVGPRWTAGSDVIACGAERGSRRHVNPRPV